MLDTGSSLNIVSRSVFKKLPPSVTSKLRQSTYQGITAAGQVLPFDGLITLSGRLRTVPFTAEFAVSDISQDVILGMAFFQQFECGFSFNEAEFTLKGQEVEVSRQPWKQACS